MSEGKDNSDESMRPELVIGLVCAVGADVDLLSNALEEALLAVDYECSFIRLIEALHELPKWVSLPETPRDKRLRGHMDAGDEFRNILGRGDALAFMAIAAIRYEREKRTGNPNSTLPRHAFVLRSLKHPTEAQTLREIYGSAFVLISAYSPREKRVEYLAREIAEDHHEFQSDAYRSVAEELVQRDEADPANRWGQNVRDTYPLADVFFDVSDPEGLRRGLKRFIDIAFGYPFHTPTRDEYAMFHAKAAALRSSALGRQVGTVIATKDGDIVAVGTNEVPRAGGGLYWPGDISDKRDFLLGHDTSDILRRNLLGDLLRRLKEAGWLSEDKAVQDIDALVDLALRGEPSPLTKGAQLMNLVEYGRVVHAEMAAITDAARRGVAIAGLTIYTTTFPCHDCAKHIVAAGIERVVYIEPYPKSLASDLYPDSISVDRPVTASRQVRFQPFVGIAPRQFIGLFEMVLRKDSSGKIVKWDGKQADPRLSESPLVYVPTEGSELNKFEAELGAKGLKSQQEEQK